MFIRYFDLPGAPSVSVTATGPNTVIVLWSPPLHSSQCIDHYVGMLFYSQWKYCI